MLRVTVIVLGLLVLGVNSAKADIYSVHLYYDNGKLVFDKGHDKKVEVLKGLKVGSNYPTGDFKAEILDSKGVVLHSTTFEPRPMLFWDNPKGGGGSKLLDQGQNSLWLPYFPNGAKLKIYDPKGALILEYDISYLAKPVVNQANAQHTKISWYWWALAVFVLAILVFFIRRLWRRKSIQQSPS